MRVLIVGWYGTETIGDRAILASLLMHLRATTSSLDVTIASIYPFHTQKTIFEDFNLYESICGLSHEQIKSIRVVDSRCIHQMKNAINSCDLLVMGGGPFDDMASMNMIEYSFVIAKKKRKKSLIYGCGINVLKDKKYIRCVKRILDLADAIILRDSKSIELLKNYQYKNDKRIVVAIDPAVFIAHKYRTVSKKMENDTNYAAINLRDFPCIYADNQTITQDSVNSNAFFLIKDFLSRIDVDSVKGIAMNYFVVGGDDRIILHQCKDCIDMPIDIVDRTLSLEETFKIFMNSKVSIGMRFHSVVLQTILNGNNYIINYTSSKMGKIPGFINQIQAESFYSDRMINLQSDNSIKNNWRIDNKVFECDYSLIDKYEDTYLSLIREVSSMID